MHGVGDKGERQITFEGNSDVKGAWNLLVNAVSPFTDLSKSKSSYGCINITSNLYQSDNHSKW
jgi:hypothetical protein